MNERQPYERHLADKLQNLPPPGEADQTWEQMRTLLDKEMPRGGAMPDRRRWWLFGIAIGVLFLATWLSGGSYLDKANSGSVAQDTKSKGAGDEKMTPGDNKAPGAPAGSQPVPVQDQPAIAGAASQEPATGGQSLVPGRAEPGKEPLANANPDHPVAVTAKNKSNNNTDHNRQPNADDNSSTLSNKRPSKTSNNDHNKPSRENNDPAGHSTSVADSDAAFHTIRPSADKATPGISTPGRVNAEMGSSPVQSPLDYAADAGPVRAAGTTIDKEYARKKYGLPEPKAPPKRNQQKLPQAGTFALGFSLPLAFPLGDQRAMGYNVRAGHNTVSDYLPSPHLQYHFNSKTFLQTEAQIASPQFIRSTLLYETTRPLSPGYYTTNSVFAKKLYYFNIPVSIHHSPFPGFYMGTGIQFSSMLSGVAMSELRKWDMGGNSSLISETYSRFRNDTLSEKLNSNEFRVLLDANYYFNRFTVGLRYNQALSNYISFRLAPGQPYSFEKNRALQFYLRYNLWEEKKKAPATRNLLSLK